MLLDGLMLLLAVLWLGSVAGVGPVDRLYRRLWDMWHAQTAALDRQSRVLPVVAGAGVWAVSLIVTGLLGAGLATILILLAGPILVGGLLFDVGSRFMSRYAGKREMRICGSCLTSSRRCRICKKSTSS